MTQLLLNYAYLQVLDLLTTIAFMLHGVQEGNPLVRWAITVSPTPLAGLLLVKLAAVGLGLYCFKQRKERLLGRINLLFAALVAWNMVALIIQSAHNLHFS